MCAGRDVPEFIGEEVEVEMDAEEEESVLAPRVIRWRDATLRIVSIMEVFGEARWPTTARTRGWWLKRRRTHWIVRADDGNIYQLTLDRTGSRRRWILLKRLPRG